jgi:hypothetical protein
LRELSAPGVAVLVEELASRAARGEPAGRDAAPVLGAALVDVGFLDDDGGRGWRCAVHEAARAERLRIAEAVFVDDAARAPLPALARLDEGRLDLETHARASAPAPSRLRALGDRYDVLGPSPALLSKIARHVDHQRFSTRVFHRDVEVVAAALAHDVSVAGLVALAARRPLPAPLLRAILMRPGALAHARVRNALVNNPSVPAAVVLALAPPQRSKTSAVAG